MVDAVEHLHQLITVCSGLYVIKQIQLRDAGRGEIVQHDAGFGIAVAGDPDPVQRSDCSSNNVPGVPRGCHQFLCCQIAITGLVDGERRSFNEGRDMPAVLVLSAQLLRCAFCMPADGLTHRLVGGDALSERTAADNLLFWRGGFFQRNARLSVQFTNRSLQYHVEVFPDEGWIRARQLQRSGDTHCPQRLRNSPAHPPDFFHRLQ